MPHHSLKNWENRIQSNDREEIMQNKPRESNENNFMALLNFIVDPAVIVGEKGCFLIVNDAFTNLTGLSKKELIGTALLDINILTAESKVILLKNLMKRMQDLPVEPYEINFTDETGKVRYVEIKAKKIDYAGQPADLVIFHDITQRKEALRGAEHKFRNISEQANDAFIYLDKFGKILDVNAKAIEMFGGAKEKLLGKHFKDRHFLH